MFNINDFLLFMSFEYCGFQSFKYIVKNIIHSNSDTETINKLILENNKLIEVIKKFNETNINDLHSALETKKIKFLPSIDLNFPEKLKLIEDTPFGIFYRGNIERLNDSKCVGIVGTRKATYYGIKSTKKIVKIFNESNITIVSGLASGIDSASHEATIKNGKTIAVLGTGLDIIYPSENRKLYENIIKNDGLIISEYPPGVYGNPWNFPQRNRIISALSDAIIVVEADTQSGALITARFAIKQNKKLFAIPGPIDSPASNGTNALIKSKVCEVFISLDDFFNIVYDEKQIPLNLKENCSLNEEEKKVYNLLNSRAISFEEIIEQITLDPNKLIQCLSILELKGIIKKNFDGTYVKS